MYFWITKDILGCRWRSVLRWLKQRIKIDSHLGCRVSQTLALECSWGLRHYVNLVESETRCLLPLWVCPFLSICRPAFLASPGLMEGGRCPFLDVRPESQALPQGEMQCYFLSFDSKFLKRLSDWPSCAQDSLCPSSLSPVEQLDVHLLLPDVVFAQLTTHHFLSHARLNFWITFRTLEWNGKSRYSLLLGFLLSP